MFFNSGLCYKGDIHHEYAVQKLAIRGSGHGTILLFGGFFYLL